jgi:3-oxoadipate enol-lactonase
VMVHGFPFDGSAWKKQLDDLGDEMWIVAVDLPGFGESAPFREPKSATMDDYADALAAWIQGEGAENVALAGHSMGGYIAFAFARKYPNLLSKLILVATRPGADTDAAREGRYKQAAGVEEEGAKVAAEAMLPKLFAPATYERRKDLVEQVNQLMLRQSKEGIIAALYAMASRPDSKPGLAAIRVPTLILSGAEDAIIPAPEAETMHEMIKDSQHIAIEGAGHMLMLENPRAFNSALRAFVG